MTSSHVLRSQKPSLEGWKHREFGLAGRIVSRSETFLRGMETSGRLGVLGQKRNPQKPSLEGWKRFPKRSPAGAPTPQKPSLEGWKLVSGFPIVLSRISSETFLRGMETRQNVPQA